MRRLLIPAVMIIGVTASLTACDWDNQGARYVQMCADRNGNYLPDYMCDSPAGIYPMAVPYYMPYNTWHNTVEVQHHHYYSGQRITGGSVSRPQQDIKVQSASNPSKVTVYQKGKQAGTPIKMNQDAKKVGTVTGQQKAAAKAANPPYRAPAPKPAPRPVYRSK